MVANQPISPFQMTQQEMRAEKIVATGTGSEVIGAAGGIALSIVALCGIVAPILAAVALIVLGVSIFIESAAIATNARLITAEAADSRPEELGFLGGLSLAAIGGVGVAVLGILALLGIVPNTLLAVGVIALGATGALASSEKELIGHFPTFQTSMPRPMPVRFALRDAPAGLELLGAVATVVLGILALVGINPAVMILTGLLVMSSAMFLSSAALTGRMARFLTR